MAIVVKYNADTTLPPITLLTAGTRTSQDDPTIAAGDVKVSTDYGTLGNIISLPTVSSTNLVQITLSASETTGKVGMIRFKDQTAPAEWDEVVIPFYTYGHISAYDPRSWGSDGRSLISTDDQNLSASLHVDIASIQGTASAATNLRDQFDGTGINGATYPARQDQLSNLVSTGAAINEIAGSFSATTGTETNTFSATFARDGVYHQIADVGGTIDAYYEFNIGATGVPTSVFIYGGVTGNNDTIWVYGYNWTTSAWVQIGTMAGTAILTPTGFTFSLYTSMVGTGADQGKVRIRYYNNGLSTGVIYTDQIYASFAVVNQSVGYANGAIWIDTVNGTAGTTPYYNGTADRPVNTLADATTLATALNLHSFQIIAGSTIAFTVGHDYDSFIGLGGQWTLDLGGQSIAGAYIDSATVSGTATGSTNPTFRNCIILEGTTLPPSYFDHCGFNTSSGSPLVAGAAGQYLMADCMSLVAGSGTPHFNFSGTGGTTGVNFRRWSGGMNVTLDSDCVITDEVVTGGGQTFDCNGADVEVRGICRSVTLTNVTSDSTVQIDAVIGPVSIAGADGTVNVYGVCGVVTDNRTGTPTLLNKATSINTIWDEPLIGATHNVTDSSGRRLRQITAQIVHDGIAQGAGADNNQIQLDANASSVDGSYDPALIGIVGGTGTGQCRLILQYSGSNRMATVDRGWRVAPDNTSEFIIYADAGREHVNEGNAQGSTATSITLNSTASTIDNNYVGQMVFVRSGIGEDQVRLVTAYNGTTKVATVSEAWGVNPDTTSAYVMLPAHFHEPSELATAVAADILVTPANKLATDASGRTDMGAVYSVSAAAQKISVASDTMIEGTVTDSVASPTTVQIDASDITDADTDHYKSRSMIFTSGVLIRQARSITGYGLVSGVGRFAVDAFTQAPSSGDTFIIV